MMERYRRNTACDGFGEKEQRLLAGKSVFILGCGALGSTIAMQLAGAGVGTLALADFDTVDITNLQRQLFFKEEEVGEEKVAVLARRVSLLNSEVKVEVIRGRITAEEARREFPKHDFIIDASDNSSTKYTTEEICRETGKACCIGGVREWRFQVMTLLPGTLQFSDIFPPEEVTKQGIGVFGPVAGMCASAMSMEAIKYLSGAGTLLTDSLLTIDTRSCSASVVRL